VAPRIKRRGIMPFVSVGYPIDPGPSMAPRGRGVEKNGTMAAIDHRRLNALTGGGRVGDRQWIGE
jgi:hypothetical protein